jgi:hypothetical protein
VKKVGSLALAVCVVASLAAAQGERGQTPPQGRGAAPPAGRGAQPPATPRASAPIDLTGYWVSVVTEDWRYRMVTPARGDYQGVPMTPEAVKVADAWDPGADEAAGNQCKSYGAPAIMRVPGRIRVSWQDDNTLRLETDAGTQTRLFRFGAPHATPGTPTWQGESTAQWELPRAGRGRPGGSPAETPKSGTLKVATTNMLAGYLRKNGVPYSARANLTEYFNVVRHRNGDQWLVVTAVVDDAQYLRQPLVVSSHFRKQADGAAWDPTPCSSTW